jgi:hypothetical protein
MIWHRTGRTPFKYKFWCLELYWQPTIIGLSLAATARQSHAGVKFGVALLGLNIEFDLHDSRHWDYEQQQWKDYGQKDVL